MNFDYHSHDFSINTHQIDQAIQALQKNVYKTPVMSSKTFDEYSGIKSIFKCEQFQRTGSFKFRGAYYACTFFQKSHTNLKGLVTHSSGNHAQALALCGRQLGIAIICCMPSDAPPIKIAAVQEYGAEIIFYDRQTENREQLALTIAEERGFLLLPSSNHPAVIIGHSTLAWELLQECPSLHVIAAPVGGGGLIASISMTAHMISPPIKIVGVVTEAANHAYLSLQQNKRVSIPAPVTIADGLCTSTLARLTWPVIQREVEDIVQVSEAEVREALRFLWLRLKLVVEPTGAVAAAAALSGKLCQYGKEVGIILSGGNIDPSLFVTLMHVS